MHPSWHRHSLSVSCCSMGCAQTRLDDGLKKGHGSRHIHMDCIDVSRGLHSPAYTGMAGQLLVHKLASRSSYFLAVLHESNLHIQGDVAGSSHHWPSQWPPPCFIDPCTPPNSTVLMKIHSEEEEDGLMEKMVLVMTMRLKASGPLSTD